MGSKILYAPSIIYPTFTLASLADQAYAISSAIDNSSTKYLSLDITWQFRTGLISGIRHTIAVFILRSVDGGVTFDDTGKNSELLAVFKADVSNTSFTYVTDTVAICGTLPAFLKLALFNNTGGALDSTPGNFSVGFVGKKLQEFGSFI